MSNNKKSSIVVIGSSNTDMVVKTERIPRPGETILGGSFFMNAGGKGANQAVAAARLGGQVTLIANVGDDIFGKEAVQLFQKEGINTRYISVDQNQPSGVALITVDKSGENNIVVASGANATLQPSAIDHAVEEIEGASFVLMQLEIPLETIIHASTLAAAKGVPVILNPAPACALPESLLKKISVLTPNEKEAEMLTGIAITDLNMAIQAANHIRRQGVETIIITLGAKGALVVNQEICELVPAPAVQAVDTTAAGDVFNGALAVALSEGQSLLDAVAFGCHAAALSVTRLGAQSSAPFRKEVEQTVGERNQYPKHKEPSHS
ncbi:MAG: ribokinase [Flavisolibacter sp.]|nr:ribokinase [Flavisolibacter sp.]